MSDHIPSGTNRQPTSKEHVCRYLELCPDGSYFCGGCQKIYRLAPETSDAR